MVAFFLLLIVTQIKIIRELGSSDGDVLRVGICFLSATSISMGSLVGIGIMVLLFDRFD